MSPRLGRSATRRRSLPAARAAARTVLLAVLLALAGGLAVACGGATAERTATAATPVAIGTPTRVEVPSIAVDADLVGVGLQPDGAMETPDFGLAGWYQPGPRPGQAGPAVVAAHVDSTTGPDVFYRLHELKAGDRVTVRGDSGAATFVVETLEQVDKDALPVDRIWNDTDEPVLRLVTCGGQFDDAAGHYRDNIIVYASLVAG